MSIAERPIHESWFDTWAPSITDARLRREMAASARLKERIEAELLMAEFGPDEARQMSEGAARALGAWLDQATDTFFHKVGLAWYAPVLCAQMLGPDRRQNLLPEDRADLQFMLAFRHHLNPARLRLPMDRDDLLSAGRACFFAWLRRRAEGRIGQFCLRLPRCPEMRDAGSLPSERVALFGSVTDHLRLPEGARA